MGKTFEEQEEDIATAIKYVMTTPKGRDVMYWLLEQAGVYRTTFVEHPTRAPYMALAMAHAEGKKDLGYRLLSKLQKVCPQKYALMVKEHLKED